MPLKQGSVIIILPQEIQSLPPALRKQILNTLVKHWEGIASTNRHWGSALSAKLTPWERIQRKKEHLQKQYVNSI